MTEGKKEKKILKAVAGSDKTVLKFGNIEIPAYVLENGQRVFSGRGMQEVLGFDKKASGTALSKFISTNIMTPFITKESRANFDHKIKFLRSTSGGSAPITYGYEATLLIDFCDAIIRAKNEGILSKRQEKISKQADIIIRSVAKVGIIALVDEATGYQKQKNEYQKILTLYIAEELQPYIKTFKEEYYRQLYRLLGWDWDAFKNTKKNHPLYIGKLTNRLVYEKLAPGILEELKKLNPKDQKGRRKHKHFQHLTTNFGYRELTDHLAQITILMEQFPDKHLTEAISKIDARFPSFTPLYQTSMDFPIANLNTFQSVIKKASLPVESNEETKH